MALLPPSPLGQPPGNSFWNDWYEKLRTIVNTGAISIAFSNITGTPTTLAGYGITSTGTGNAVAANNPTINNINLTGTVTTSGNPGISVIITTAKLTVAGANGNMTFVNGILTAQTQAT